MCAVGRNITLFMFTFHFNSYVRVCEQYLRALIACSINYIVAAFFNKRQISFLLCNHRQSLKGGGGGGGGFSPDFCENTILRYGLAMMARTCTNNLRVVLSP